MHAIANVSFFRAVHKQFALYSSLVHSSGLKNIEFLYNELGLICCSSLETIISIIMIVIHFNRRNK